MDWKKHGGESVEIRGQFWVLVLKLTTLHKVGSLVDHGASQGGQAPSFWGFSHLHLSSYRRHTGTMCGAVSVFFCGLWGLDLRSSPLSGKWFIH